MGAVQKNQGLFGWVRNISMGGGDEIPARQMLEDVPVAVMMCDLDFNITYLNKSSREALRKIEKVLPVSADRILGQNKRCRTGPSFPWAIKSWS